MMHQLVGITNHKVAETCAILRRLCLVQRQNANLLFKIGSDQAKSLELVCTSASGLVMKSPLSLSLWLVNLVSMFLPAG